MPTILLTGGAGYIGSHTAVELLKEKYNVVIADNLSNSDASVIENIGKIAGRSPLFYDIDVADRSGLDHLFNENSVDGVIHFAGFKAVGESVAKPLEYYRNNLDTTIALLEMMKKYGCRNLIFSSSATVYGEKNPIPYREDMPVGDCSSPYGWTKFMIEKIITDAAKAEPEMSVVLLRYFNPIGADPSGLIGENPRGIPNNLMPYITQAAMGIRDKLTVFGGDYPTADGTCIRDFIHVSDLAKGHAAALRYADSHKGTEAVNLGTGEGHSVLEVIKAFEKVNNIKVPYEIGPRRDGDLAAFYADASKAGTLLGWHAEKSLEDMCRDSWRWQHSM